MSTAFSNLLKPGKIGNLELKNRIVMAPMGTANATPDGHITEKNISYYSAMAQGGTGLLVVESTYMDKIASQGEEGQMCAADNSYTNGLAILADTIHDHCGVKCALQLCHEGQQVFLADRFPSWGPSDLDIFWNGLEVHFTGMTVEQIKQLQEDTAQAAWRAKVAGFDAVEIHSSGGHLLNTYLSPAYNKRTDEYGGSIENRMRNLLETIDAVRKACGPDFPILVRFCGDDGDRGGLAPEESVEMAKLLDEAGIAAIDLNGGSLSNGELTPTMYDDHGKHVYVAEAYKKAGIKTPIIIAGAINTPQLAESILAEGKADFIGLGRPLLADPDWVRKLKADRPEDIIPCIRCGMGCVGTMEDVMGGRGMRCAVNPLANMRLYRPIKPATTKKKVAIIGGGPAGMEAARVATLRGHDVTLYEKRKLGGALLEAAFDPEIKGDINLLIDYYVNQMDELGVKVINESADANKILQGGYDAVIIATGATSRKSRLPGIKNPNVLTGFEATGDRKDELGQTVIVVGGGTTAAEIAISQARKGKKVIMTTRRGARMGFADIASNDASASWQKILALLMKYDVDYHLQCTIKEFTKDGVLVTDAKGKDLKIKGDSVVYCGGMEPESHILRMLNGRVDELYTAGDVVAPRTIGPAILEGFNAANSL